MELICPECKETLRQETEEPGYICKECGSSYTLVNGIPSFLKERDTFYEGRFVSGKRTYERGFFRILSALYHAVSISSSRERFIRKSFRRVLSKFDGTGRVEILDLGCGGGIGALTEYGNVTGIDISIGSLQRAGELYSAVIHADVERMPFPDNCFDIVFSADLVGHVPQERKERVISEIFRVTKPSGFSVHSIESDSKSLFFRWAKRYPALYRKYFIDMYGHVGLEPCKRIYERFRMAGFIPVKEKTDATKGYLREVSSYAIFFDNEYKTCSKGIKILVRTCRLLAVNKVIRSAADFLIGFFVPVAAVLTPKGHRDSVKVIYQKPMEQ